MTSRTNTTKTRSWETKWHKSCNKIRTCQIRSQKNTERHQKNSKMTLLWPWSPKPWPLTCSSNTTTAAEGTLERKISPHGENHFSKRRSESESYSEDKSIDKIHRSKSISKNSKSDSKGIKMRRENKPVTFLTDSKAKVTAKVDEVKAIKRPKQNSGWK
jgi:hypothetical protein